MLLLSTLAFAYNTFICYIICMFVMHHTHGMKTIHCSSSGRHCHRIRHHQGSACIHFDISVAHYNFKQIYFGICLICFIMAFESGHIFNKCHTTHATNNYIDCIMLFPPKKKLLQHIICTEHTNTHTLDTHKPHRNGIYIIIWRCINKTIDIHTHVDKWRAKWQRLQNSGRV